MNEPRNAHGQSGAISVRSSELLKVVKCCDYIMIIIVIHYL